MAEPQSEGEDWYNRARQPGDERASFTENEPAIDELPPPSGSSDLAQKEKDASDDPLGDTGSSAEAGSLYRPTGKGGRIQGRFRSIRGRWRQLAIGGGLIATIIGGVIAVIGSFLPMKLEFIFKGMDEHLNAATDYAISERVDAIIGHYMTQKIFRASSGDAYIGSSLISTLFGNWSGAKYENRLYERYGITFEGVDADGNSVHYPRQPTHWRVDTRQGPSDKILGPKVDLDLLDRDLNKKQFRRVVKQVIKSDTHYFQVIKRVHQWRIMKNKFQVPDRIVPRQLTQITASYRDKKLTVKKWLVRRAITPFSSKLGALFMCFIDIAACKDILNRTDAGMSQAEIDQRNQEIEDINQEIKDLQSQLEDPDIDSAEIDRINNEIDALKTRLGELGDGIPRAAAGAADTVDNALDSIDGAPDKPGTAFDDYLKKLVRLMSSRITQSIIAGVGIIGIVDLLSRIDEGLQNNTIGQGIYAMQMLNMIDATAPYLTTNSQVKRGDVSAENLGLILDSFDGFEKSIIYQQENGALTPGGSEAAWSGDTVHADGDKIAYDCDGDNVIDKTTESVDFVTYKNPVCSHMILTKDYRLFADEPWYQNTIAPLLAAYRAVLGGFVGAIIQGVGAVFSAFLDPILNMTGLTELITKGVEYMMGKIISPACTNLEEGALAYDCLRGGMEVLATQVGEEAIDGIGAPYAPPDVYNKVTAYQMSVYQEEWQRQPLFARLFSTDSHRSLLAQAIIRTPSSVSNSLSSIANAITSPFKFIGSAFGGLLSPVMAINDDILPADWNPYEIIHYAYPLGDPNLSIEPDTGVYANCEGEGFDDAETARQNSAVDPDGEDGPLWALPMVPNYCALEKTAVESLSALTTDIDLDNPENNPAAASDILIGQDIQQLAQQILAHPNFTFENYSPIGGEPADCGGAGVPQYNTSEPDSVTFTLQPVSEGRPAVACHEYATPPVYTSVSAELLRVLLQAANDGQHLSLKGITSRSHSENSEHYVGLAVDLAPNDTLYRYIYENSYAQGGNFCVGDMIYKYPPAGTSTMRDGADGTYDTGTLDGHSGHIHLSVLGNLSACGR